MSRKVLSVSIAAYNAADYVREAINSLLIEIGFILLLFSFG